MDQYEELPPGTDLITAIRAEKSPYYSWAGEVVDNALDAEARNVSLRVLHDRLDANDDGIGITKNRERSVVQIASHGEMVSTKLGRFGVGLTYKSIQHGKTLVVKSTSADGVFVRRVDWEEILLSRKWSFIKPQWIARPPQSPTGTFVSIRELLTKPPSRAEIDRIKTEISRRYYPALESGKHIHVNGEQIEPIAEPSLSDAVDATLNFPQGRIARVHGGMLVHAAMAKLRQVDLCVAFRVIKPESPFGCNGYGGIRSMFARIDLVGPWKLTKFKDDIAEDPYLDDLEREVEGLLRPILEKCQSQSMALRHKQLEQELNLMLPEDQQMTRPEQKQKLDRKGPKIEDKSPKNDPKSQPSKTGPVRNRKPPRGIMIEFAEGLNSEFGYGRAQFDKRSTRIQLSIDNPTIAALVGARDQRVARDSLFAIAMLIFEGDLRTATPNLFGEPIGKSAWEVAAKQAASEIAA